MSGALTPRRVEAALWFVLCGGLGLGIGYETDWGRQLTMAATAVAPAPASFTRPEVAEPFHLPGPDAFLETTLRPLFVVTRRPAPIPPPPEPPKPSMKKDQFVLTGTTIVPEGKFAYLLDKAANKVRVVREGNEVNGVLVSEIAADRVVLIQYDDSETLILKPTKPSAQPAPPAGQPGAAAPTPQAPPAAPGRRPAQTNSNGPKPPFPPPGPQP